MNAEVTVCTTCGLLQTLPRWDDQDWPPSLSYKADFGGVRIGKEADLETFQDLNPRIILDIGASRGAFHDAAKQRWPEAVITAVEPDKNICRSGWFNRRIEEVSFGFDSFDFIYCVHTLEHLPDPVRQLARVACWLKPEVGFLYLEVPNVFGTYKLRCEEFFIDRHLYHFSANTLDKVIKQAGLRVIRKVEYSSENIGVLCTRSIPIKSPWDNQALVAQFWLDNKYKLDFKKLQSQIKKLNDIPAPKAALGAGRIFHACLDYGLDLNSFVGVYDDVLVNYRVDGVVVQPNSEIPAKVTKIAFSRNIEEGIRFDA